VGRSHGGARSSHRREGGIRFEPKSRIAERGVGMGSGWVDAWCSLSMHGCPTRVVTRGSKPTRVGPPTQPTAEIPTRVVTHGLG
jgi:hypothetical protein